MPIKYLDSSIWYTVHLALQSGVTMKQLRESIATAYAQEAARQFPTISNAAIATGTHRNTLHRYGAVSQDKRGRRAKLS